MRIDRITLTHVRIPLVEPFRISKGEVTEKDGIIVRVAAEGLVGVGEASPMSGSFYSQDTPESVWAHLVGRVVPGVLAARAGAVWEVDRVLSKIGGSPFACAGVETAFWDLEGQASGKPLYEMLGGGKTPVASGLAVGIAPDISSLLRTIETHLADGYKRLKIKIQPGWDVGPLGEIRQRFGDIPLMVDANCAYGRRDITHLASLDAFQLMMIEQPLAKEDLAGHASLQRVLRTPVCLDEGAENLVRVRKAIALGSCRVMNIKIQRVGGLTNAKAIHDLCEASGIPVWAGTMPELGIGAAQTLHLATLPNFAYPTDVESSRRWFVDDIVDPLLEVEEGMITLPAGAGNGYALSERAITRFRVAEQVFHA